MDDMLKSTSGIEVTSSCVPNKILREGIKRRKENAPNMALKKLKIIFHISFHLYGGTNLLSNKKKSFIRLNLLFPMVTNVSRTKFNHPSV